ncbi:MAG: Ldh family oxidoreductase [Acidobacteriota bacterium]|nr:Ldh family oxidoreductase [Acidobacteriota bacterium]
MTDRTGKGRRARAGDLRTFAEALLERAGLGSFEAKRVVDNLMDADLRGVYSHGLSFLDFLVGRVRKGGVNPRPKVRVVSDRGAVLLLDADRGPGQVASHQAMSLACSRARETGVAAAGVFRSNHFGTAGYYARMAADQGLIGLAVSNTGACMAPWGGSTPTYGTNPLAIAVPTGGQFPVMIDIAISRAAWGKIMVTLLRGDPIPGNWVLDRKGVPTTDPEEVVRGMPAPMGNHKGYGLAVMVDILSGVLTGALFGRDITAHPPEEEPQDTGHFFLALSVEHFMEPERFLTRVQDYVSQLKSSELAPGFDEVLVPGDPDWRMVEKSLQEGVRLEAATWKMLERLSAELGVPCPERF